MTEKIQLEYTPKPTIPGAFVKVCADVENVKRDKDGQAGGAKYKYATLESVLDVLQPLLAREGLGLAQYVEGDELVAKLYHESGAEINMGRYNLGGLVDHQKRGSAITYARRYQLCAIFGITQEDDDAASASGKPVFKSNALRNAFLDQIDKQMDASASLKELDAVISEHKVTLGLLEGGNEYDAMALSTTRSKYKAVKARLEEAEELVKEGNKQLDDAVPY